VRDTLEEFRSRVISRVIRARARARVHGNADPIYDAIRLDVAFDALCDRIDLIIESRIRIGITIARSHL